MANLVGRDSILFASLTATKQESVILNAVKDLALTCKLHIDLCRSSLYRLISDAIDWRIMSNEVRFIDTTVRDGNQSLWALNMKIGAMLPALPHMDEAGFESMEFFLSVISRNTFASTKKIPGTGLRKAPSGSRRRACVITAACTARSRKRHTAF